MSQQTSFTDILHLYLFNRDFLKDWTFIVATTEENSMDLYEDMEDIEGIRSRMFTPFANGRVNIINDRILRRCLTRDDSRARIYRSVSFDTQTVSYIERYYKNGSVPHAGFETVVDLLKGGNIGVDHIPYTLENLMFDLDKKASVEQTLFAYEMMLGENAGNAHICKKQVRNILSMYEEKDIGLLFNMKEQYKMIYLSLLKMSQIQLEHPKLSINKKMKLFIEFIITKLFRIMQPEINLAKVYFSKGTACGFFGKIQASNTAILEQLKNMTWDLMHLRFMNYSSILFNTKKGDALIPYFFTYDTRLQDVSRCYSLQALAFNTCNHSIFPIYVMGDDLLTQLKEYVTLGKHKERMSKTPDTGALIAEYEQKIVEFIQQKTI